MGVDLNSHRVRGHEPTLILNEKDQVMLERWAVGAWPGESGCCPQWMSTCLPPSSLTSPCVPVSLCWSDHQHVSINTSLWLSQEDHLLPASAYSARLDASERSGHLVRRFSLYCLIIREGETLAASFDDQLFTERLSECVLDLRVSLQQPCLEVSIRWPLPSSTIASTAWRTALTSGLMMRSWMPGPASPRWRSSPETCARMRAPSKSWWSAAGWASIRFAGRLAVGPSPGSSSLSMRWLRVGGQNFFSLLDLVQQLFSEQV